MRQLLTEYSNSGLMQSTAGTWGELQIIAAPDWVVMDVHARNYDASGHLHRDTAMLDLPIETAIRLRALLSDAIEAALDCKPRQPPLWSDATTRAVARRVG